MTMIGSGFKAGLIGCGLAGSGHAAQAKSLGIELVGFCDVIGEAGARINRPNFGLAVEPANLLQCGEDYGPEAMRRLGPHVFIVQVQNLRLTKEGSDSIQTHSGVVRYERLIVGEQVGIDFDRFFKGLNAIDLTDS